MKLTPLEQTIAASVGQMSMLKFFPSDEFARAGIMSLIQRMAGTIEQVNWLTETVLKHYNEWPGPQELRAVFCTRYPPKDGVEADLTSGALANKIESMAISACQDHKQLAPASKEFLKEFVDPEQAKREQSERWKRVSAKMPALEKNCRKLCQEFATTASGERREEILRQVESTVAKMENERDSKR